MNKIVETLKNIKEELYLQTPTLRPIPKQKKSKHKILITLYKVRKDVASLFGIDSNVPCMDDVWHWNFYIDGYWKIEASNYCFPHTIEQPMFKEGYNDNKNVLEYFIKNLDTYYKKVDDCVACKYPQSAEEEHIFEKEIDDSDFNKLLMDKIYRDKIAKIWKKEMAIETIFECDFQYQNH